MKQIEKLTRTQGAVYYVPTGRRGAGACDIIVEKVGRKWAYLSNGRRVEIGQTAVDGGQYSSPGRIYASKDVYEYTMKVRDLHMQLYRKMTSSSYEGMTVANIVGAAALLGIELDV